MYSVDPDVFVCLLCDGIAGMYTTMPNFPILATWPGGYPMLHQYKGYFRGTKIDRKKHLESSL